MDGAVFMYLARVMIARKWWLIDSSVWTALSSGRPWSFVSGREPTTSLNVLYYYKAIGTDVIEVESPETWTLSGPFDVSDYKRFEQTQLPSEVANGTPGEWDWGNRKLSTVQMEPEHTWVDFARWFRRNEIGNTGTQPDNCAAYASTVISSREERNVILRLGFDDWLKVWLNGQPISTLQHDDGFKVTELPITLKEGDNDLVIRLSNFNNIEWRCWAFSCVIRNAERVADLRADGATDDDDDTDKLFNAKV